jgi:hypothetical protein
LILGLSVPVSIYEMPDDLLIVDNDHPIALDNASIVDVINGRIIRSQKILIRDGKIETIQPAENRAALDPEFTRIDLKGAFVSPGLFDMHVHIHDRKYLGLYLAYGVTTVRNLRGLPMHLRWKQEISSGEWLGSNLITSSPVLDGEKYSHLLQEVVTSPGTARELVIKYKADGYDLIKAYGFLDADVYEAIVDEAAGLDFPVAKHGTVPVEGLDYSSIQNLQSLEHVEDLFQGPLNFEFDESQIEKEVEKLAAIDAVVTPTLATFEHLTRLSTEKEAFVASLPLNTLNPLYARIFRESTVQRWLDAAPEQGEFNQREMAFLQTIVKEMDRQGIKMLLGSDGGTMYMPAGLSTHDELRLMQESGLSPQAVLQSATKNAAEALGIAEQTGAVEPGKIADLVITSESPLDDVSALANPLAVVKYGQWLGQSELDALLTSGQNPSSLYVSVGRLLEDLLSRL